MAVSRGTYELFKSAEGNISVAITLMVISLLPLAEGTSLLPLADGTTQEVDYDIYDFMKEKVIPIVIGIMTVVGAVTSLRTVSQLVGRCPCRKKNCYDKAVQTVNPAPETIYPDSLWVSRAGERYHTNNHCSGFRLHKVTPCAICVSRGTPPSEDDRVRKRMQPDSVIEPVR